MRINKRLSIYYCIGFNVPMLQHVPLFIGLRYIRAKRRNQFISFVSGFSLLGMVLGVAALVIVMSVMNGLDRQIKEDILKAVPHGFIDQKGGLEDWLLVAQKIEAQPNVVGSAPYIEDFGLLRYGNNLHGLQIQGILPHRESTISEIDENLLVGNLDNLEEGGYGIILSQMVANYMGVDVGDQITVTSLKIQLGLLGAKLREKRFRVVGLFDVSYMNQQLAFVHVADAQTLFRYGARVQGLRVKTEEMYQAPAVMQTIAVALGEEYQVKDWTQTQSNLFQAIKMEKIMVFLMLSIVIAIAALNIISSLVLMVADKRGDIAVLRTLGMTGRQIMSVFVIQGSTVGLIGLSIGLVVGGLGAIFITDIIGAFEKMLGGQIYDPSVFVFSSIPSEWHWQDSLIVTCLAAILSIGATLYPAFRASTIEPAEALRYE